MYHPTGRVLTVLELLQSRPGITGPELADRLETDVRTVRRYVAKLQDVGIPVEANPGRYGGYRLRPGYKLPPLIFSEEEAVAMVLGLLGSTWLEIEQSQAAVSAALSKITRVLPQGARERVQALTSVMILSSRAGGTHTDASLLLHLSEAVQARQCVEMDYATRDEVVTQRVVEPYGLVGRQGRWYLVGYCRLRKDYRTFRLDRIRRFTALQEVFTRNETFDYRAYAVDHLEAYPAKWIIKLLFKANLFIVRNELPSTYDGTLTETPEGVFSEWPMDNLNYAGRYLLLTGLPFVVLEPPQLREALAAIAQDAAQLAQAV